MEVFKVHPEQMLNNLVCPSLSWVGLQTSPRFPFSLGYLVILCPHGLLLMGREQMFPEHEVSCAACDHQKQGLRAWKEIRTTVWLCQCKDWELSQKVLGREILRGTPGSVQDTNGSSFLFESVRLKDVLVNKTEAKFEDKDRNEQNCVNTLQKYW